MGDLLISMVEATALVVALSVLSVGAIGIGLVSGFYVFLKSLED